ncbi:MAG: hypothetical protein P8L68_03715 [Paracoccaceae bacterium]|nr:hypothetical protein [Paracoccaceae bacterium]MDG2257584.1 hypothetical protein [Paracoccaceae bacterium]
MKKIIFAALAGSAMFVSQPVFAAFSCEARTYAPGLTAARGSRSEKLLVIKSWITETVFIGDDEISFLEKASIEIDSYTTRKIRASYKTEDTNGKKHNVVYEVVFRENQTVANITVRQNRFRPLGPVIFDCKES